MKVSTDGQQSVLHLIKGGCQEAPSCPCSDNEAHSSPSAQGCVHALGTASCQVVAPGSCSTHEQCFSES